MGMGLVEVAGPGGGRGGHATELPGRGQYSLSEKLRARRKLGNTPRCDTPTPKVLSPGERARLLEFSCSVRAQPGTRGTGLKAPRPARGAVLLSQGSALRAASGLGDADAHKAPFPARRAASRGPSPGLGRFPGRGQRPGCSSEGTGSGSGSPPAQDSL